MDMFGNRINSGVIVPTSKIALKMSCLQACNNNIEQAAKLYDYIAADLDLPAMEPQAISGFDRVKETAVEAFNWFNSNKAQIMQGIDLIRGMRNNVGPQPNIPNVPPIPDAE